MKSFTSAILAAAVSANYCYTDGCNCTGASRACYPLPRQNMRPAVNTCCPVGVQPTVYGRNNGRSVNIPQTVALKATMTLQLDDEEMTCAQTFQASNCSSVAYSQRKACEKARSDARTVCEQTSANERTEAEKTSADERKEAEKTSADERKESEKAAADERVTSALIFGGCQDIDTSATVTGEDGTCFTVKSTGTTLTLAPASPDMTFKVYLQGSQNNVVLGNGVTGVNFDKLEVQGNMNHAALSPESTINQVSMKGSNVKITGNPTYCKTGKIAGTPRTFNATQSSAVCAQYSGKSNLMLGATEDTWSPTTNLRADCAATFQARTCAYDFQGRGCNQLGLGNARKECEKRAGDVRKECEKDAGDVRKECEKGAVDEPMQAEEHTPGTEDVWVPAYDEITDCAATFQARQCAQVFQARGCNNLGLGNARKECEKRAGDVRKECEKDAGDVRKECEKAQVSNLQVYGGGNPNTHLAKLDDISVKTKNTENTLNENGFSGHTKNSRYSWSQDADGKPVIVWENKKGSRFAINNQTSTLNWTNAKCRDYCSTTGAYPPLGCGQMTSPLSPYAEPCAPLAATTSLFNKDQKEKMGKTDGSWSPRDSLAWSNQDCTNACSVRGHYPVTKCQSMPPCVDYQVQL